MMMVTLLIISLTAALPSVYQEAQREKEEELIFRGRQYQWAIYLFHRQFQRYPTSMKELLETNGMHFLRKEYKDPMDPKGKWRFIHVNAAGVLLDSKLQPLQPGAGGMPGSSPLGPGGSTMMPGGSSMMPGGSSFGSSGSSFSSGSSSFSSGGSSFMSGSSMSGTPTGQQPTAPGAGTAPETEQGPSSSASSSSGEQGAPSSGQAGGTSSFFGSGNQIQGASIVGVAATSHKQSIRVWNKRTHYDEWEFIGVDLTGLGFPTGIPGVQATPTQGPGFGAGQGQPGFGQGQSGFGSGQGQSGFGSGQGQSGFGSGQSSFGSGQPSQPGGTATPPSSSGDSSPDNPPQ